jgi:hypothetical protein
MRTPTTIFLPLLFFCFCFQANAQLDSVSVSASFESSYLDGSDSVIVNNVLVLGLSFDDISDLGYLNVAVYDAGSNMPIGEFVRTREELQADGLLLPDRVEWPLFPADPGTAYRIEVSPRNLSGAYTRLAFITVIN